MYNFITSIMLLLCTAFLLCWLGLVCGRIVLQLEPGSAQSRLAKLLFRISRRRFRDNSQISSRTHKSVHGMQTESVASDIAPSMTIDEPSSRSLARAPTLQDTSAGWTTVNPLRGQQGERVHRLLHGQRPNPNSSAEGGITMVSHGGDLIE